MKILGRALAMLIAGGVSLLVLAIIVGGLAWLAITIWGAVL